MSRSANFNLGRASAEAAANRFEKAMNGIGVSKAERERESGLKCDRSGQNKSDKLHSYSSLDNFKSSTKMYFEHVKQEHGTLKGNINNDTLTAYLQDRLDRGEIKESTANSYLSSLSNISIAQEKMGMTATIDAREVAGNLQDQGYTLSREYGDRAYNEPTDLVNAMERNTDYGLSTTLQYEHGLRVGDATDSDKWRVTDDGKLEISGSKNGVTYQTDVMSPELRERVERAIENEYSVSDSHYTATLKANCGEEWNGTHGLRYNFAQERVEELKEQGYTYREALEQTSLEMGHSRPGITEHYLSRN